MLVSKLNIRAICKTMCEAWTICSSTRGVGVPSRVGVGPAGVGGGVTPQAQVVGRLTWWRWVLNGFKTLKSGQYPDYQALPAILIDQAWLWQKKTQGCQDFELFQWAVGPWNWVWCQRRDFMRMIPCLRFKHHISQNNKDDILVS